MKLKSLPVNQKSRTNFKTHFPHTPIFPSTTSFTPHTLSLLLLPPHTLPAPAQDPSHMRQSSTNFSSDSFPKAAVLHQLLQYGDSHAVQSLRKSSPAWIPTMGSQNLLENLLQNALLSACFHLSCSSKSFPQGHRFLQATSTFSLQ